MEEWNNKDMGFGIWKEDLTFRYITMLNKRWIKVECWIKEIYLGDNHQICTSLSRSTYSMNSIIHPTHLTTFSQISSVDCRIHGELY